MVGVVGAGGLGEGALADCDGGLLLAGGWLLGLFHSCGLLGWGFWRLLLIAGSVLKLLFIVSLLVPVLENLHKVLESRYLNLR